MRTGVALSLVLVVGLAAVGSAWAFSCPTLVNAANMQGDDRQNARNAGMIEGARALAKDAEGSHAAGKHGLSEAQAKASTWLAEQVK
jgi:hypothetical protein